MKDRTIGQISSFTFPKEFKSTTFNYVCPFDIFQPISSQFRLYNEHMTQGSKNVHLAEDILSCVHDLNGKQIRNKICKQGRQSGMQPPTWLYSFNVRLHRCKNRIARSLCCDVSWGLSPCRLSFVKLVYLSQKTKSYEKKPFVIKQNKNLNQLYLYDKYF